MNDLIAHIAQFHTTELGAERIKRNLSLATDDAVQWCAMRILEEGTVIRKNGKNWYADTGDAVITINAQSYTIITAHKTGRFASN